MKRWYGFIRERFSLFSHLPMVAIFSLSQVSFLQRENPKIGDLFVYKWAFLFVFYLSFFFLLRCYDEIKDFAHDLIHNPSRPLPRGLITVSEVKAAIVVLIGFLSFLFYFMGALPLGFSVLFYSFLMYQEFFVGNWIRPHLTFYAVTHTFVIGLCSFVVSWSQLAHLETLPWQKILAFALFNWSLFNVFEFARKTFALGEEKPVVPSYSKTFGTLGAVLLSVSQFCLAVCALYWMKLPVFGGIVITLLSLIVGSVLVLKNTPNVGKAYRQILSGLLFAFYIFC